MIDAALHLAHEAGSQATDEGREIPCHISGHADRLGASRRTAPARSAGYMIRLTSARGRTPLSTPDESVRPRGRAERRAMRPQRQLRNDSGQRHILNCHGCSALPPSCYIRIGDSVGGNAEAPAKRRFIRIAEGRDGVDHPLPARDSAEPGFGKKRRDAASTASTSRSLFAMNVSAPAIPNPSDFHFLGSAKVAASSKPQHGFRFSTTDPCRIPAAAAEMLR